MAALCVCVLLVIACGYDYLQHRIPNSLLLLLFFTCIGRHLFGACIFLFFFCLVKMAGVMLLAYPLFKIGCIGAGDVKLLGICGGCLPVCKIPSFLFFSLLSAAVFSLIKIHKEHNAKERLVYLWRYLTVTAQTGKWSLYLENEKERKAAGICLSGPIFLSVLFYLGGAY